MGSKVTADERIVRLILAACKKHGLFYLDSKTNPNSVVPKIGKELGVPIIENQLFLMMCIQQDIFQNKPNYSSKNSRKTYYGSYRACGPQVKYITSY